LAICFQQIGDSGIDIPLGQSSLQVWGVFGERNLGFFVRRRHRLAQPANPTASISADRIRAGISKKPSFTLFALREKDEFLNSCLSAKSLR
jgi:hypothetical protein